MEEENKNKENKSLRVIFKDVSRQILASVIILVVGFFALNYSAYLKIAKSKIDELTGNDTTSFMHELTEDKPATENILKVVNTLDMQKKQIPPLEMEVTPVDDRLIIPRIDQNIPIVKVSSKNLMAQDWNALEKDMQEALKDGVVHYPGTSVPGQTGNTVITGHSSYFPWDPGRFKDVFALLHKVVVGDEIVIYYDQQKYRYKVTEIKVVMPDNIDVLKQTPSQQLTLITCTPVGTNLKRLIVIAEPIED
ncbi:MAG: sortase [Candidatus Gracilibacteria bacterium]|jgi:LPXTG-site transpeptidase (sortase) family protein